MKTRQQLAKEMYEVLRPTDKELEAALLSFLKGRGEGGATEAEMNHVSELFQTEVLTARLIVEMVKLLMQGNVDIVLSESEQEIGWKLKPELR